MTFNNHSGWKLLKACRKCIFSEYLYTLHVCTFVLSLTSVFFSLTSFAYVSCEEEKKEKKEEVMSSTSNVYMN